MIRKYDFLTKLRWDINMFDLNYKLPVRNINFEMGQSFLKLDNPVISVADYISSNLSRNDVDITPFQIAALRIINQSSDKNDKSNLKEIKDTLKSFFDKKMTKHHAIASGNDRLLRHKRVLNIFDSNKTLLKKENNMYSTYFYIQSKIKTFNRLGINDLSIFPHYLNTDLEKEIYLYRNVVKSIYEENDSKIKNVEYNRYTKSIINLNSIFKFLDLINNKDIQHTILNINLYTKNIIYYSQIIMSYHNFYKSVTIDLLNNTFDTDYEWNLRESYYIPRDKDKEDELPNLKSVTKKYINTKNKNYFYSDSSNPHKFFYDTIDTTIELDYPEYENDYAINLINKSNRELIENLYLFTTDNEYKSKKLDNSTIIKFFNIIYRFNKEFHDFMELRYNKAKYINTQVMKLSTSNIEYEKYRYNIIEDINNIIRKNVALKLPISIMLLYMARYPFEKEFYKYINHNMMHELYDNLWLYKSIIIDSYIYLNDADYNILTKQMYKSKLHKYNSSNNQLKNENDENIIKNFIQHKKITKYDRLYNLFLERRFIWYLSKTIYSKKIQQQIPYNIYNNIYTALNIRSKYTNNKLSLNNIEYILKEYININNFIHNIAEIPYLYYTNSLNRKKIYMQMEAVMGVARMEYKEHPLIFLFYKHNPFQLCESNISKQLFVYYSIGQITYWDKKGQYIIYPVYSTKNKKCIHSFIRYRIQDIDIEILKEINLYETFETTKLFKYILYSDIIKQLGEIKKITIYQEYFNHIISNNHLQYKTKMLYYHMYNKINIGTLNYLIDVTNDHNRYNQLINLLDVTKNNLPYLKYTYHNIIDEISGYYFTEEKTGSKDPSSVAVSYDEETTGYTHLPYTFELENILLFRFMHNLEIKKLIFSKKEYKISLNSNRLALLFYSILTEPIGLMAMYLMMEFMDTESLSIIKYNLQRIPKLTSSDLQYILAFPLEISIGEDFEEEPEDDILFGSIYLRTDYYGIQNYVNWPEYIDDDDELGNLHIAIETEPLRLIGIELNISPLFRIFTFSGWKVWKETINLLLLFQNNKLWNINYYIDTTIFNNLYSSMSNKFINKPIQSISDLRETLKSYNLHENILQPYLNKYHRANNLHSMKEWFDWYSYGLFEYQRTIPISYEKIFTQPAIRLFLYYFFINNKEYQFLTKNTLNNLMGSIYSMQLNPLDNEEFFVYPNKRVHAYRTYTPALLKRASWLENYSKPISNYQLPRTGYEAYIYSYASNLWYTHHNLITSSAFWHEIYKGIDYFSMEDPGDIGSIIVQTKYYLKKIKNFLFAETNKKEYGYLHKPYDRSIHRRFRCTEHEISPENIVSRKQAMRLYNAKEFIMYDLLKDFFVPNTVKFNDLNLLYKAFTYKQPIENNTNIKLHPSIQDKYTIKTNHRIDSYTNSLNIIYPKQKANKMLFFSVIYTNSIPEDKLNLIRGLNPLYSYINIQPSLKEVVKSHIWYSKSLINSNAVYHENSYGPLWSIYQRNFVSTKNALNNVLIGNTKEVINDGLVGLKRGLLVDPVDDAITDISRYEKGILLMPSTLPIKAGVYPEVKTHSTQEIEDVIALFEYNQENLNSDYHSRINVLGNEEGHYQHRSYGNMLMKVLHSMYFPINMYNQKEYTSYIPIGYNLNVKDLLNSNYQRLNYWYNPVYKRLYNTFYDIKIIHSDMSRLSANPTHVFELANLSEENNLYKDIRDSKSKYYMLNSESSYFNEFKKKLISKTLDTEKPSDTNIKSDAQKRLFIWYKQISNTSKQIGNISKQMSKIIKDKLIETYPIRKSLNKKESSLKQKELKNVTKAREHLQQEEKHIEQKKGYLQQRIEDERKYIKHTQAGNIYLLKEAFIQPYVKMYKAVKKGYNDMGYYIYTGAHTANKIMREQVIKPLWGKIWKKQPVLTEQQLARLRYREHQIIRHREQLVAQFLEDFRRNPSDLLIRQMNEFATGYEDTYKGLVILSHYDPIVTSEIVLCMYHLDPNLYHKTMVKMIRDHPKFVDIHIQRILYDTTEIKKRYESDKRFHTLLSFYRSKLYGQGDTKDFLFGPFIRFYQGVKQIDVYKYVNNIYNIYNNINVISSTINKEIKKGIYNSTNFITNSINSKIINTHKNINNLTNILQEQIINNTTIKVKNIPSYNILQKTIDDLNLEIETQEEEVSEEIIEDTESRIDLVQGYRTYGQYRYPDLYFPIFQSYAPQKQPHQLNKILNNAIIYKNRYRFIDIYESFRIKPFLYAQKDDISCKNSIINYHINNTKKNIKKFINYFIYPFENQISNNRSTKRLLRLELDTLESPYIRKGINYYESYKKFLEEEWQQKYLKFYTGFKIVEGNEYIDYKSIGFNLNKPWLFKLTNIIHKFDWYNRTIQSRYQKASKNFFPTVIVNRLSTRMGLSKYENINYNIRYHPNLFLFKYKNKDLLEKYFPVIPEKDKSKEERLQFQKKVIKGVENYVKLKERIRRRKELEGTHASSFDLPKIVNNKKMNYKIPKSFLKALEIEELSEKKNDLTYMYGKRQNKNFFTMKNYFIDRFSKPKDAAISPQYNIPVKTIQTNHGIRREFNTSRTYMEIISKYQFDFNTDPEIMDPDMIEPIEHEPDTFYLYQDQLIDALTEEWETPKELLINNILKNINTKYHKYLKEDDISQMIEEIQPLNNVFYKNKHDDNIDTIYDTVGRTVYSEKKKGFSYKINDFISSKSYNFFNNWTYYTKYFVDTVINTPIAERYNYNIKPFKYSVKKYNFRDHIYDLLENRSNLYIYSNQITEPLVLTPHPGFAKVVRQRHYFDKDRFVIRDDSIVEHDDIEDMERFHKNLPASSYNTEESIYRTSYWQYMMPKSLYNSSKFNTMEFITYKSNPHAAIDQSDNETFNTTIIKGSSINKEIAYNYKINYKKYSLPLIEYLYYTQFGVDNTNLLQINKLYILSKYTPTIFNEYYNTVYPYILEKKKYVEPRKKLDDAYHKISTQTKKTKTKKLFTFTENLDNNNISELINSMNYMFIDVDNLDNIYLYNNTMVRPITHWFLQIYYNNIHYFDAFFSWCNDLITNIIIT